MGKIFISLICAIVIFIGISLLMAAVGGAVFLLSYIGVPFGVVPILIIFIIIWIATYLSIEQ